MINKNISEEILKKKKTIKLNFKKSVNTLDKLAVYRIFNEIIVDVNKNPILTKKLTEELTVNFFNNFVVKQLH